MQIPFSDRLRVDRAKIVDYLLSESNSRGKAPFFLSFGFRVDNWEVLAESLKAQARSHSVVAAIDSNWGTRYSIDGPIDTPSGWPDRVDSRIRIN